MLILVHGFRVGHHGLKSSRTVEGHPERHHQPLICPALRSADLTESTRQKARAGHTGRDNINAYVAWLNDFVEHTNPTARMQPLLLRGRTPSIHRHQRLRAAHPELARAPLAHQPD